MSEKSVNVRKMSHQQLSLLFDPSCLTDIFKIRIYKNVAIRRRRTGKALTILVVPVEVKMNSWPSLNYSYSMRYFLSQRDKLDYLRPFP